MVSLWIDEFEVKSIKTVKTVNEKGDFEFDVVSLEGKNSNITLKIPSTHKHSFVVGDSDITLGFDSPQSKLTDIQESDEVPSEEGSGEIDEVELS